MRSRSGRQVSTAFRADWYRPMMGFAAARNGNVAGVLEYLVSGKRVSDSSNSNTMNSGSKMV